MGGGNTKPIGRYKKSGESLREIQLYNLNLSDDVITQIIEALLSNASIREVCLDKCSIGGRELERLVSGISCSMCHLRLDLSGVTLGVEGVKTLSPLLTQSNPRLHSLVLNGCCLGNAGAAEVCGRILDTGVELRNLELGSNGITSEGVKECSDLIGRGLVRGISLYDNKLSARSADFLSSGMTAGAQISWLSLGHNCFGGEGCEILVRGLRGSPLLWLGLGGNAMGDRGAKAIADWLKEPSCQLRSLGISQNGITDRGATLLVRALQSEHSDVRYLGLSHNFLTDKTCQSLSQLLRARGPSPIHFLTPQKRPLSTSSFNTVRDLTPRTPQHAPPVSCPLSKLLLAGNQITDLGAALLSGAIAENAILESLSLADNPMGDEGLICLGAALSPGNNLSLRSLDIQGTRVSPEAELRFVKMLSERDTPLKLGGPTLKEREIARPKSGPLQRGASRLSLRSQRFSFRRNRVEEFQV